MVWYAFNVASKIDSKGVDQGADLVEQVRGRSFQEGVEESGSGRNGFL